MSTVGSMTWRPSETFQGVVALPNRPQVKVFLSLDQRDFIVKALQSRAAHLEAAIPNLKDYSVMENAECEIQQARMLAQFLQVDTR